MKHKNILKKQELKITRKLYVKKELFKFRKDIGKCLSILNKLFKTKCQEKLLKSENLDNKLKITKFSFIVRYKKRERHKVPIVEVEKLELLRN